MSEPGAGQAYNIVLWQLVTSVAGAVLAMLVSRVHAYSAFIGGCIAALANAYFARKVFKPYRAQEPGKLLFRLYGAEMAKLLLTGLLFVGAIMWVQPLSVGALFGAYFVVQLVPFVYSALFS